MEEKEGKDAPVELKTRLWGDLWLGQESRPGEGGMKRERRRKDPYCFSRPYL